MGHSVFQRSVKIGEDLSEFDKIILTLDNPNKRGINALYNTFWALYKRPDIIITWHDWLLTKNFQDLLKINKENLFRKFYIDNHKEDIIEQTRKFEKEILIGKNQLSINKHKMLLNVYSGGDINKFATNIW